MEVDERGPLLASHYATLARAAGDLVSRSSHPAATLDDVVNALRGYAGVTQVRVLESDGRVIAPTAEGGTVVAPPEVPADGPRITEAADGGVEILQPAKTTDGQRVVVRLAVDSTRIIAPPGTSPLGPVFLLLGLLTAFVVARRLTRITDTRLSRLGEEIELMTTGQTQVGRDPFVLRGGQRVIDAATFVVSQVRVHDGRGPAGRVAGYGLQPRRSSRTTSRLTPC